MQILIETQSPPGSAPRRNGCGARGKGRQVPSEDTSRRGGCRVDASEAPGSQLLPTLLPTTFLSADFGADTVRVLKSRRRIRFARRGIAHITKAGTRPRERASKMMSHSVSSGFFFLYLAPPSTRFSRTPGDMRLENRAASLYPQDIRLAHASLEHIIAFDICPFIAGVANGLDRRSEFLRTRGRLITAAIKQKRPHFAQQCKRMSLPRVARAGSIRDDQTADD
jgi:hypothetical protein